MQGLLCPFSDKEMYGSEAHEGPSFSIPFSGALCTSPGCLPAVPGTLWKAQREDTDW